MAFARATDAVAAAVASQRALTSQTWPEGVAVRVRMGLHTGEPHLAADGYIGLDVHRAARIMKAGHGGQILLSQTTRDLVEHELPNGASLRDLGAHRLKDLEHPAHLYQLVTPGLPADFPPLGTLDTYAHNLPVQLTPLIGREREVAAVGHLLQRQEVRLLTLTGPGGIGKTRLGLQVAAELTGEFSDGVFFVNLAPLIDPELVVPTIAQALGLKEAAGQPPLDLVSISLREKELLLLLDNFEQVVGAALQVAALLARCPKLNVLVTSRAVLHVRGEQEFAVPPLAVPDPNHFPDLVTLSQYEAVALFIARAQAVKPDFQVTNVNAQAVAEICVRLDGLPLAIELAAARGKVLPPQALLSRLGQRFTLLTSGAQDVPARQQTLRNTIAWSYDLLDAGEQLLFRRLSVFVGGSTPEAIEALYTTLGDEPGLVLDGIASLIDKSLLRQTEQEAEEPRFVMLETIREYGREALAERGELEATQVAHASYYLRLSEEAEPELEGAQQIARLKSLEREYDNLREALRWSLEPGSDEEVALRRELALRSAAALRLFWSIRHLSEGQAFIQRALAASVGAATVERAKALVVAAELAFIQGDLPRVEALAGEALALCREVGDRTELAKSFSILGSCAAQKGELARARSLQEESVALFKALGDKGRLGWSLWALGGLELIQGEYGRARTRHEEALALFRELGDQYGIADQLVLVGQVLFFSQEDLVAARSLIDEGLMLVREVDNKWLIALSLNISAELALIQDDLATTHMQAEEALALSREVDQQPIITRALSLLARAEARQGNYSAARSHFEEFLALVKETDEVVNIAFYLGEIAEVVAGQGEGAWAVRLWGAAASLRERLGIPLPPAFHAAYEGAFAATRTQLGEKDFAAAWAQGRMMTPEQALTANEHVRMPTAVLTTQPSSPPSEKSPPTYPDGLTAREVEVLRLVAQGLSNAEIAEQLIISLLTVKAHMRSLYNKLGIGSRSAATRYAIEHHLM